MSESPEALVERARAWIGDDSDPETRAELAEIVERRDLGELEERLAAPLGFGTAGLRGIVGAGPARMNRAVVTRTTRALAEHLLARERDARALPVVVGFDCRHSSRALADAAIRTLTAAGIPVRFFPNPVPTPVVAYAVRALAATAGIVITASHNPAEYNGYKLFMANGAQIVAPADSEIEHRLESIGPARSIPIAQGEWSSLPGATAVPESLEDRYLAAIDAERPHGNADRGLRIVYTPMHGVGGALARSALTRAGFDDVIVVPEQAEPDGSFPTVRFPNPEEPGALALALALAEREHADLVLANDPDADRLAVAVPTPAGRYVTLTGNQIGALLADFALDHAPKSPRALVVSTIVSSPMVGELARARAARFETTLTGFKWIWSAALALTAKEPLRFVFGYEEAIGFCFGSAVHDKDGIGAALGFAELAARCRIDGVSVLERLFGLYARHGLWSSAQRSVVRPGADGAREIARAVDRVAGSPPAELDGMTVHGVVDYRRGADSRPPWLAASPLVALDLGPAGRALLRPSGTEPKLKIYVDLRRDPPAMSDMWSAEEALRNAATRVANALADRVTMQS